MLPGRTRRRLRVYDQGYQVEAGSRPAQCLLATGHSSDLFISIDRAVYWTVGGVLFLQLLGLEILVVYVGVLNKVPYFRFFLVLDPAVLGMQ